MNTMEKLLLVAAVWAAIGMAAAIVMGRRGHNPFAWLILGATLGPLCIPVAMVAVVEEHTHIRREVIGGRGGQGPVDILVGIDGSRESEAALRRVGTLFGTRVGRLTLARVEDFDTAGSGDPLPSEEGTALSLERLASEFGAPRPSAIILSGRPAEALIRYATDGDYELIAIGRRGCGASKAIIGSTASRLARGAEVPVLIV
jgi:nucleotide-binding universal stress UspA family protein